MKTLTLLRTQIIAGRAIRPGQRTVSEDAAIELQRRHAASGDILAEPAAIIPPIAPEIVPDTDPADAEPSPLNSTQEF